MIRKQTPSDLCRNHPELKCVPRDLGDIIDYYTGLKDKPNQSMIGIICSLFLLSIYATFSYIAFISPYAKDIDTIFLILGLGGMGILLLICRGIIVKYGCYNTEYYICTDGLAEYTYDKKSGQVMCVEKAEHHFNEIAYLQRKRGIRTIEVDKWWYPKYYKSKKDVPEYIFVYHLNNGDIIEHDAATKEEDEDLLSFLDKVEKTWSDIVFEKLMADRRDTNAPLAFDCSIESNIRKGYVLVDENGVRVGIDGYEDVFAKEVVFIGNEIRIRFEDKPMIQIPKDCFPDIAVFFKALNHFYNIDIDYYFNGDISF